MSGERERDWLTTDYAVLVSHEDREWWGVPWGVDLSNMIGVFDFEVTAMVAADLARVGMTPIRITRFVETGIWNYGYLFDAATVREYGGVGSHKAAITAPVLAEACRAWYRESQSAGRTFAELATRGEERFPAASGDALDALVGNYNLARLPGETDSALRLRAMAFLRGKRR